MDKSNGRVDRESKMTLAVSPQTGDLFDTAMTKFGLNVRDLLYKNFPYLKVEASRRDDQVHLYAETERGIVHTVGR